MTCALIGNWLYLDEHRTSSRFNVYTINIYKQPFRARRAQAALQVGFRIPTLMMPWQNGAHPATLTDAGHAWSRLFQRMSTIWWQTTSLFQLFQLCLVHIAGHLNISTSQLVQGSFQQGGVLQSYDKTPQEAWRDVCFWSSFPTGPASQCQFSWRWCGSAGVGREPQSDEVWRWNPHHPGKQQKTICFNLRSTFLHCLSLFLPKAVLFG